MMVWGLALVLPFYAAPQSVVDDSPAEAGALMRPSWEVRAAAGPAYSPDERGGIHWGAGALKRWQDVGVGAWVDRAQFEGDKTALFLGATGRAFPIRTGRIDPFVKLDLGWMRTACDGAGLQLGAGFDVFITDFLKLGVSSAVAGSLADCSVPAGDVITHPGLEGLWVTTGLELVVAPTDRQ